MQQKDLTSDLVNSSFFKIENLWESLRKMIDEYERITKNKSKQYEYLKEQHNIDQMLMLQYPKTCSQLQNVIENLKSNIAILRMKRNSHIEILKAQTTDINKKFKDIKRKIVMMQIIDSSERKKLIITSNEILTVKNLYLQNRSFKRYFAKGKHCSESPQLLPLQGTNGSFGTPCLYFNYIEICISKFFNYLHLTKSYF